MSFEHPVQPKSKKKKSLAEIRLQRSEAGKKGALARAQKLRGEKPLTYQELEEQAVKKLMQQRFMRASGVLIDSQISLARGQSFLYRIDKEYIQTGTTKDGEKKGYWKNKKPVQVSSQGEIEAYLENIVDNNGELNTNDDDESASYYYITTKEPNNEAIKNILDRVHGKPTETQVLDVNHNFSLVSLDARRDMLRLTPDSVQMLPPPAQ